MTTNAAIDQPNDLPYYCKLVETNHVKTLTKQRAHTSRRARSIAEQISSYTSSQQKNNTADLVDTVTVDVPLLIRLLEYAKEDAETDMDLHQVADRLIELSKRVDVLSMSHYQQIVSNNRTYNNEKSKNTD